MNWLYRWMCWPRFKPVPVIRIIENWVCLVIVVERRPWSPVLQKPINWQANRPPKQLKRNRHKRRSRNRHPRHNPPY